jgi:hypothetical protein
VNECASPDQINKYVEMLTIKTFTYENMMNWNLRNGDIPLSKQLQFLDATFLNSKTTQNLYTYIHFNELETIDDLFPVFDEFTVETNFYSVGKVFKQEMLFQDWDPDAIYWNNYILNGNMYNHERKIYNSITLISDLGGVSNIFISFVAFFVCPISSFLFHL